MEMTREQFMELFGLNEGDAGMEYVDECMASGFDGYWEMAKSLIATTDMLLR